MKRLTFLILFLSSFVILVFSTNGISVSYPSSPPTGPLPSGGSVIVPCYPLTFGLNLDDLISHGISEITFQIDLSCYFDGNTNNSTEFMLGYYLADPSRPLILGVCGTYPVDSISHDDVKIEEWMNYGSKIKITVKNINNWQGSNYITFKIFLPSGVYPDCDYQLTNFNYGETQDLTLLSVHADYLSYYVAQYNYNRITVRAHVTANVVPNSANLDLGYFDLYTFDTQQNSDLTSTETAKIAKKISKVIARDISGDLNARKRDTKSNDFIYEEPKDFVWIDRDFKSMSVFPFYDIYSSLPDTNVLDLPYTPLSLCAGDIDGDGKNEILVSGDDGSLNIYTYGDFTKSSYPINLKCRLTLPGEADEAILTDVNNDGKYDYVYVDSSTQQVTVLYGENFSNSVSYNLQGEPHSLVDGDFNGDGFKDICVAKTSGYNLSILYNNGDSTFSLVETNFGDGGPPLVGIDKGDFNRDGFTDVACITASSKGVLVGNGSTGGLSYSKFIGLQYTPSAIAVENFDGLNGDDVLVGFEDYYNLLLCTSDSTGDITPSYAINTLADVTYDAENKTTNLDESGIVTVEMGIAYGGVNNTNGMVGIVKGNFNLLFFPESKNISFSVINPSSDSSMVTNFELMGRGGSILNSKMLSIAENEQFARYFTSEEIFGGNIPEDSYVRLFISNPEPYGMYLFNTPSNPQYMDGGKNLSVYDIKTTAYFPFVMTGGDKRTELFLINPYKNDQHVKIYLFGGDGTLKESKDIFFNGKEEKVFVLKNLFQNISEKDYVKVFVDRGFIGVETYGDESNTLACVDGLYNMYMTYSIYCPHVAWGYFGNVNYYSQLSIINISDVDTKLKFTLYDDDGNVLKEISNVDFKAHSKLLYNLKDFFNLSGTVTGYLKITSNTDRFRMVGAITFGDADNGKFIASLPLSDRFGNFITAHIANGEIGGVNYFTGIAILSPYSDVVAHIKCYDQSGNLIASKDVSIGKGKRFVRLLDSDDLFPDIGDVFGGHITITTDNGWDLLVFQLFGDDDLTFLSAVPAVLIGGD